MPAPKESAIVARTREISEAVDDLRALIDERLPAARPEVRGYVSEPRPLNAAALSLRFCRNHETGESLAKLLRRVPDEFVDDDRVRCVCGGEMDRSKLWTDCPGGCGRVFIADDMSVWAARLSVAGDG